MTRPLKCRRVGFIPEVTYFKPAGIPLAALKEVRLSVEETEAIRLKDVEGLEQEQGAERMNISRPTFQRILMSARQKMADALLTGKAVRIEGGSFEMDINRFKCLHGHEWEVSFETMISRPPQLCPTCSTPNIEQQLPPSFRNRGRGWGRHRGRRGFR
jgi:predicted DNA-binding protein (UPF0251 family)